MALPDRIAALPGYLESNSASPFADAAPGHRFQLYFRNWQGTEGSPFTAYKGKVKLSQGLFGDQKKVEEKQLQKHVDDTLGEVCLFGSSARQQVTALRARQSALSACFGGRSWSRLATSTAPFATGLGNEHPIENGFSFLAPYGLPYLAGSGVKGVLRRAAEALVVESPESGWTWLDVWWMFGFEGAAGSVWDAGTEFNRAFEHDITALAGRSDLLDFIAACVTDSSESARYRDLKQDRRSDFLRRLVNDEAWRQSLHLRGAVDCWDVFPEPAETRQKRVEMVVEIMTPHQTKYYEGKETPHDAGQPNPISFLALPAGSAFDFHIICNEGRLPARLLESWSTLLDAAAVHAFDWLGFGAKTAVGYGAMEESSDSQAKRVKNRATAQAESELALSALRTALMAPEDREQIQNLAQVEAFSAIFETARKSTFNPGGAFNQERNKFIALAMGWTGSHSRVEAGNIIESSASRAWGRPSNKERWQELQNAIAALKNSL